MKNQDESADRIAGALLVTAAAGTVLAMAHHPTSPHAAGLGGAVHGSLIVLLATIAFGFTHFAMRRGLCRPAVLAGLVAYAISLFAHAAAATINGFVVPALAARGPGAAGRDIFLFAWETNQALARIGVYATGAAFLLWSTDLLRRGTSQAPEIGLAGLTAGAVPALLLAAGVIAMDLSGAFLVYATHAGWTALVGLHLLRGRLGAGTTPC